MQRYDVKWCAALLDNKPHGVAAGSVLDSESQKQSLEVVPTWGPECWILHDTATITYQCKNTTPVLIMEWRGGDRQVISRNNPILIVHKSTKSCH